MKFLIVGDLHGQVPRIRVKEFDAIIAPGDFCADYSKKYIWKTLRKHMLNESFEGHWADIVGRNKARQIVRREFEQGKKVLSFLNTLKVPVFGLPGNWEVNSLTGDMGWFSRQCNRFKNLFDLHLSAVELEGCVLIGHGFTSGPEFRGRKRSIDVRLTLKILDQLFRHARKTKKPVIFLSHNVPYNTKIDLITDRRSPRCGEHMGSMIARHVILKWKPAACIGAHMHEHYGKTRLGKTICVNAGFGKMKNTVMEISNGRVKFTFFGTTTL